MHDGAVGADVVCCPLLGVTAGGRIIENALVDVAAGGLLGGPQGFYVGGALSFRHGAGRRGEVATFLLGVIGEDKTARLCPKQGRSALVYGMECPPHTGSSL